MLGFGFIEFKLEYSEAKNLPIGQYVTSESFPAGGHLWKVVCYPRGDKIENDGEYVSFFLKLLSNSVNIKAFFDVILLHKNGMPSLFKAKRSVNVH
ncbi:unnamed protein product [Urochloa humidicola]